MNLKPRACVCATQREREREREARKTVLIIKHSSAGKRKKSYQAPVICCVILI
jgi:hypothetical protein